MQILWLLVPVLLAYRGSSSQSRLGQTQTRRYSYTGNIQGAGIDASDDRHRQC